VVAGLGLLGTSGCSHTFVLRDDSGVYEREHNLAGCTPQNVQYSSRHQCQHQHQHKDGRSIA